MGLQGDLTSFDAADVLRLLSWTKKSGTLDLSGDRGHGVVHVRNGQLLGGEVEGTRASTDAEVVYELLRFRIGTFLFEDGEPRADREPVPVDGVLADAGSLLSEWKAIESVVPDFDHAVRLVSEAPGADVTVTADEWRAIVGVGGGGSVRDLGERLDLSDLAVGATVRDLVERGLVEVAAPAVVADDDVEPAEVSDGGIDGPTDGTPDGTPDEPADGDEGDAPSAEQSPFAREEAAPIRPDYEPGLDAVPAGPATATATATTPGPLVGYGGHATAPPSRASVDPGRTIDRPPSADLGAPAPAPPPPSSPPTQAPAPAAEPSSTWQPAWTPPNGTAAIPTVGGAPTTDQARDTPKGRRRFRRG